jgi:spectinomycin phosphotransferase
MLEKPGLEDGAILACLRDAYGLPAVQITFLPLGADQNTAVYRAAAADGPAYLVKLRSGAFDETSVALPKFLGEQGIKQIIAPLTTRTGQLWADLEAFKAILYPFVEGRDGYEVALTERQWIELGAALRRIHTMQVPPALARRIRREAYSPQWREMVKGFLARVEQDGFDEPVAARVAALLRDRREQILDLVGRAEGLARALGARPRALVLCHSDLHAGNVLIDGGGALYLIDWDEPILAPKERDLMYPGGGQWFLGRTPEEEERLFYLGYGPAEVDTEALAYYRYERIVQDIAVFCQQLLSSDEGGRDREQSLRYLASNFAPQGTIEIAYESDKTGRRYAQGGE